MGTVLSPHPTLSPNTRSVSREREQIVRTLTQGSTGGSCPWCCPGLTSHAPLGLYHEERPPAASQNLEFSDDFNAWSEEKSPKKLLPQLQS